MTKITIILVIVAVIMALPSLIRIMCNDYRSMFWSDVMFDIIVVAVAILFKSIVIVVVTEVLCNMFVGWIYQKRADAQYKDMDEMKKHQSILQRLGLSH